MVTLAVKTRIYLQRKGKHVQNIGISSALTDFIKRKSDSREETPRIDAVSILTELVVFMRLSTDSRIN